MSVQEVDAPYHRVLPPLCKPDARDTVLDRLSEVAHALPDATAVVADDGRVTYDELVHRVYSLARRIEPLRTPDGLRPLAVAAVATTESIALLLAVIASGHALIPLDADLPEARTQHIIDAASAVRLDPDEVRRNEESARPLPVAEGGRTAMIAFTSGSTEAVLSHRRCLTMAHELGSGLSISPRDRIGNALPVSSGAGINTLFAGILSGATVHCRDPRTIGSGEIADWIDGSSLTTLHCPPSLIRSMSGPIASTSLRIVTTYGEPLHSKDVIAFRAATGTRSTFVGWYALTEAGSVAEYAVGDPLPDGVLAVGTDPAIESADPACEDEPVADATPRRRAAVMVILRRVWRFVTLAEIADSSLGTRL